MFADPALHFAPELPEWRRSGRFLLIAVAIHAAVLFYPLKLAIGKLDVPEPSAILVKLIEKPATPQPVSAPPVPVQNSKPQPTPAKPAPTHTPTPRQVIAVAAEANAPAPTFSVPTPVVAPPTPVAAAPSAPAAVTAARFNAAYLNNPEPKYPPISRRLGEEGKVLLKVRVTTEGAAATVDLEKTSGFERLDEAARQAVARWRFVPAKRGDEPIEASVIVPIVFRLDS